MKTKTLKTQQSRARQQASEPIPSTLAFTRALDLLDQLGRAQDELQNIQAISGDHLRTVLRDIKPRYAHFQSEELAALRELETLCRQHPEWFENKKTLKTLYGTLSLRASTELDVPNEDAAIARLEREAYARYPGDGIDAEQLRSEFLVKYTRTKVALNKEALECEDSDFLSLLGLSRIRKENFTAKPATLDLAKSTADPEQKAA